MDYKRILIAITIISLLISGYLFVQNRKLSHVAEAYKRIETLEKKMRLAREHIQTAEDLATLFSFSFNENIEEETYEIARSRLSKLGNSTILFEWDKLREGEGKEEAVYSLRIRNLFLAILREAKVLLTD